jgi:PKD repeat protein
MGPIVRVRTDPVSGDLFWVHLGGLIQRFTYNGPDAPPVENPIIAAATAYPTTFFASDANPVSVQFNSDNTFYPNLGSNLYFKWDFGDGTPAATTPNPVHVYTKSQVYTATMTVSAKPDMSDPKTVTISLTGKLRHF